LVVEHLNVVPFVEVTFVAFSTVHPAVNLSRHFASHAICAFVEFRHRRIDLLLPIRDLLLQFLLPLLLFRRRKLDETDQDSACFRPSRTH
jgi:hypothetical protein